MQTKGRRSHADCRTSIDMVEPVAPSTLPAHPLSHPQMSIPNHRYAYTNPNTRTALERRLARLGGFFAASEQVVTSPDLRTPTISVASLDSPALSTGSRRGPQGGGAFSRPVAAGIDLAMIGRGGEQSLGQASAALAVETTHECPGSGVLTARQSFVDQDEQLRSSGMRSSVFEDVILGGGASTRGVHEHNHSELTRPLDTEEQLLDLISSTLSARRAGMALNESHRVSAVEENTTSQRISALEDIVLGLSSSVGRPAENHRIQRGPDHEEEALLGLVNRTLAERNRDASFAHTSRSTRRRMVILEEESPDPYLSSSVRQFSTFGSPAVSSSRRHSMPVQSMYSPEEYYPPASRNTIAAEAVYLPDELAYSRDSPRRIYPPIETNRQRYPTIGSSGPPADHFGLASQPGYERVPPNNAYTRQSAGRERGPSVYAHQNQPFESTPLRNVRDSHNKRMGAYSSYPAHDFSPPHSQRNTNAPSSLRHPTDAYAPAPSHLHDIEPIDPELDIPGRVSALREVFETKLRQQRQVVQDPLYRHDARYDAPRGSRRLRTPTSPPAFGRPSGRFAGEGLGLRNGGEEMPGEEEGGWVALRGNREGRFGERKAALLAFEEQQGQERVRSWAAASEEMQERPLVGGSAPGRSANQNVESVMPAREERMLPTRRSRGTISTFDDEPATQEQPSNSTLAVPERQERMLPTRRSREVLITEYDSPNFDDLLSPEAQPSDSAPNESVYDTPPPQIVLSPPQPMDLSDIYNSLHATGMLQPGLPMPLSLASNMRDAAPGLTVGQGLPVTQVPSRKQLDLSSLFDSRLPKKIEHLDFMHSSASDGARSEPPGTPHAFLSPTTLMAAVQADKAAKADRAAKMKPSGSATPSDYGDWKQYDGIEYGGPAALRDDYEGLPVVDDRSPDVCELDEGRFEEVSSPAEESGDDGDDDDVVLEFLSNELSTDGRMSSEANDAHAVQDQDVCEVPFAPPPAPDGQLASQPVHPIYGVERRSSPCEDVENDPKNLSVNEDVSGSEIHSEAQDLSMSSPLSPEDLVIAPSAEVLIDGADGVGLPQDLPSNSEKTENGVDAAKTPKTLQHELVECGAVTDAAPPGYDVDQSRDASMCGSMDQSFARAATTATFRIPQPLDTSTDQSFVSTSPPPLVLAHTEPCAALSPSAGCAAVLPDDSEFAGAPLSSFPESEFLTLAGKLPMVAELPSKDGFPPLDSWEDICTEMNYLCSRLGIPCTVTLV